MSFWPILLKKSALISMVEKYALEIEIFTLSRGFRAQISRSGAQKTYFQRSVCGQSEKTDFFNRIGRFLPIMVMKRADQIRRSRCSVRMHITGQVECNFAITRAFLALCSKALRCVSV